VLPTGSFTAPVAFKLTIPFPGVRLISPVVVIVDPLISKSSIITEPVPFVLSSKSLLDTVVVIKLSSIKISPVEKLFDVIVPVLVIFPTLSTPSTERLFVISTLLFGIKI
jgi:hypothetical protein